MRGKGGKSGNYNKLPQDKGGVSRLSADRRLLLPQVGDELLLDYGGEYTNCYILGNGADSAEGRAAAYDIKRREAADIDWSDIAPLPSDDECEETAAAAAAVAGSSAEEEVDSSAAEGGAALPEGGAPPEAISE